jgi:hypothetical protein
MQNALEPQRSVLLSFKFAGVATLGSLAMALVCALAPPEAQLAVLGGLVSILAGLLLSYTDQEAQRDQRQAELLQQLGLPLALTADRQIYEQYVGLCQALGRLAMQRDPILRDIAALRTASMRDEIETLADGTILFAGTEAWRTVYERLLRSRGVPEYQSVALAHTKDYWQDEPGRQSLAINFDAVRRGVLIERIVILGDELWPADDSLPVEEIRPWIEEQHNHGLWISLVRESRLSSEPDLLEDIGIYGNRAVGKQELDERGKTVRFRLSFNEDQIRLARTRWERLKLFAVPYRELLDRISRRK